MAPATTALSFHFIFLISSCSGVLLRDAQVAEEAHADGLLSKDELDLTREELRGTYRKTLLDLGVNPDAVPEPRPGRVRDPHKHRRSAGRGAGDTAEHTARPRPRPAFL